jgi:hypothetical protein
VKFNSQQVKEVMEVLNDMRSGGFVFVKNYAPVWGNGEVADYHLQFGISYASIKARDIADLTATLVSGKLDLKIQYGTWMDQKGEQHSHKAKGRVYLPVQFNINMTDPRLQNAVKEVLATLKKPAKQMTQYTRRSKGVVSKPSGTYIREVLRVHKRIQVEGEHLLKASSQDVAIKAAVWNTLRVSRYRQFVFEAGIFQYIIVNGTAITFDANGEPIATDPALLASANVMAQV